MDFMSRSALAYLGLITLLTLAGLVLLIEPAFVKDVWFPGSYLPFYMLLGLGCFWLMWAITLRWKRSLLWCVIMLVFVWLRINQLDLPWNLFLLIAFGLIWEYYWRIAKPL